tara:strand:+ start:102 stop:305 length:204 start_codon:yes stop_codon:yes gene_type:complete
MGREKKQYNAWLEWELVQRSIAGNGKPMNVFEIEELCGVKNRNAARTEANAICKLRYNSVIQSNDAK